MNTTDQRSLREKIYHVIDNEEEQSFASRSFEIAITILILMSIVSIVLESFAPLRKDYGNYFDMFESVTLIIFAVEYFLRLATADFKYKDSVSLPKSAWRLATSGSGLIDLLAISPLFFHFSAGANVLANQDFRFLRILKVTRLLRVFKMNHFTNSIAVIVDVCIEKRSDLGITTFVTFILLFVSATLMWYMEGQEQPEVFPNILATLWWAVATLTTVGYGDVYPITPAGKVMAGIIALLGIGLVALPAGILSSAFIEKLEDGTIKEEEVDEYTPKGIMPQAQFQTSIGNKKNDPNYNKTATPLNTIDGDCKEQFGTAFVYCPYCGKPLSDHT
jgi:voltage-gated potassium channel